MAENREKDLLPAVLHHFHQGLPVFEAYRSFCSNQGGDAMSYRDFDFWWHRFKEGEFELDYDRTKDRKQPELFDIPIDIVEEIFKYLNWAEKRVVRKVSKRIRDVLDIPYSNLTTVSAEIREEEIELTFGDETVIYRQPRQDPNRDAPPPITIEFPGGTKIIEGNYGFVAMADLASILLIPKLEHLSIKVNNFGWKDSVKMSKDIDRAFASQIDLYSEKRINVKKLSMMIAQKKNAFVLDYLAPGILEEIEFSSVDEGNEPSRYLDTDVLCEFEQWKQARILTIDQLRAKPEMNGFANFRKFHVHFGYIALKHVFELKQLLLQNPNFEFCRLVTRQRILLGNFARLFGPICTHYTPYIRNFYIPGTNKSLKMTIDQFWVEFSVFDR